MDGELGGWAVLVRRVVLGGLPAGAGAGRSLKAVVAGMLWGTAAVTRCPSLPQCGMKSQGAGTARPAVGSDDGEPDQENSAKECERAEEEDGALGDGHRPAAGGRLGPGVKASTQSDQGVPGGEQKDTRNRVVRVHQQENARFSEWVRGVGR
jgi:hypothetical protein